LAQVMALAGTTAPAELVRPAGAAATDLAALNAVGSIAKPMFTEHLLAFELTSILLLVAIVGAVVLGKRRTA
ncbi:MAG: hypothetical protein H7066_19120, partial [Cytophagaceae bacterium]|nr:hypothetical protein [Gemmatimonadaceae bacterium]